MEYMVCVKAVPDENEEIHLGKDERPVLSGAEKVPSAFDRCALEMAVRQKETSGSRVTAVSLGGEECRAVLKNCVAVGADHGAWIQVEETDAKDRAKMTAEAVKQAEKEQGVPFDVIFCGIESTDLGNGIFGPALAEFLDRPYVTDVTEIEQGDGAVLVKKETENGYEIVKMPLPAVVMVTKTEFNPRYPTLKSKMAARKAEIAEWGKNDDAAENVYGELFPREYSEISRKKKCIFLNTDPENAAAEAMKLIMKRA